MNPPVDRRGRTTADRIASLYRSRSEGVEPHREDARRLLDALLQAAATLGVTLDHFDAVTDLPGACLDTVCAKAREDAAGPVPEPEPGRVVSAREAYADAPGLDQEAEELSHPSARRLPLRERILRHAALADRRHLLLPEHLQHDPKAETSVRMQAYELLQHDREAAIPAAQAKWDQRAYVRAAYHAWLDRTRRTEGRR